jgi:hypothetical protein
MISLNDFKQFIEYDLDDTSVDSILQIALDSAQQYVSTYCNSEFTPREVTYSPSSIKDTKRLELPFYPITGITSIKFKGVPQDLTKFYVENYVDLISDIALPTTRGDLEIVIQIGYTDIPSDIKYAILKIADKFFTDVYDNRDGVRGYDSAVKMGEDFRPQELPESVEMILIRYKKFYL